MQFILWEVPFHLEKEILCEDIVSEVEESKTYQLTVPSKVRINRKSVLCVQLVSKDHK